MTENRSNYFGSYLLFQLGRLKVCTIFSVIFAFLGFPLTILTVEWVESFGTLMSDIAAPLFILSVLCVLGTCAMSYITPILAFRHMYTKTNADNILSLPLTTDQRFLGDILATYISYALPYFLSSVVSLIFGNVFFTSSDYLVVYPLKGALMLVMFGALNIAVMTLCGRIAEAILYPIAINCVFPVTIGLGAYFAFANAVGMENIVYDVLRSPIILLSPFGNLIGLLGAETANTVLWGIIGTVLYLGLSYIGYKKRRAENIGKPFVFRFSYLITSSLVAIALIFLYEFIIDGLLGLNFSENNAAVIIVMAIIIFIAMLLMEVINYKKVHHALKFILHYGVTFGIGLGACFLLSISHGFGLESYIPDTNDVEQVCIRNYRGENWKHLANCEVTVYSPEMIELVRAEHKTSLDIALSDGEEYNSRSDIYFDYQLKNGQRVYRRYDLKTNLVTSPELWETLYNSEDYRVNTLNHVKSDMDTIYKRKNYIARIINTNSTVKYGEADVGKGKELLAALEADLRNDTDYNNHKELPLFELSFGCIRDWETGSYSYDPMFDDIFYTIGNFTIYPNYTNTISYLGGLTELPTAEKNADDAVKGCEIFTLTRVYNNSSLYPRTIDYNYYNTTRETVFITADEYKELMAGQTNVTFPKESKYVYFITKGMDSETYYEYTDNSYFESYVKDALSDIGIGYSGIGEGIISYNYENGKVTLNSGMSERCDGLFISRDIFYANR